MKNREWLERFKLAVIEGDLRRLGKLQESMPEFEELDELMEASALIRQAKELFEAERLRLQQNMRQMKQGMEFQKNRLSSSSGKLDINY